jgi:hypothetical protein
MPSCFTCNNLYDEQAKPLPGLSTTALPHPEFLHSSSSGSRPGQLATPDILPHSLLLATHQVACNYQLIRRSNGTAGGRGLGYWKVGLEWPCNTSPLGSESVTALSSWRMWTILMINKLRGYHSVTTLLEPVRRRFKTQLGRKQCFGLVSVCGSALIWLSWIRIPYWACGSGSRSKKIDQNQQINLISSLSKGLLFLR